LVGAPALYVVCCPLRLKTPTTIPASVRPTEFPARLTGADRVAIGIVESHAGRSSGQPEDAASKILDRS
jgi:hypothetical protein